MTKSFLGTDWSSESKKMDEEESWRIYSMENLECERVIMGEMEMDVMWKAYGRLKIYFLKVWVLPLGREGREEEKGRRKCGDVDSGIWER